MFRCNVRCIIFLLLLSRQEVQSQDETDEDAGNSGGGGDGDVSDGDVPKSCYRYSLEFIQSTLRNLVECVAELRPANFFEYATRSWCLIKCILQKNGAVGADGKFDPISAAIFFEENFAPKVQEGLVPDIQRCSPLTELFINEDYWCKSYAPFSDCLLRGLVREFLPYAANCFALPALGIVIDTLKNIAPDPILQIELEDARRQYSRKRPINCMDAACNTQFKIKRKNGTATVILYDKNMTEISRQYRPTKVTNLPNTNRRI